MEQVGGDYFYLGGFCFSEVDGGFFGDEVRTYYGYLLASFFGAEFGLDGCVFEAEGSVISGGDDFFYSGAVEVCALDGAGCGV